MVKVWNPRNYHALCQSLPVLHSYAVPGAYEPSCVKVPGPLNLSDKAKKEWFLDQFPRTFDNRLVEVYALRYEPLVPLAIRLL